MTILKNQYCIKSYAFLIYLFRISQVDRYYLPIIVNARLFL